MERHYKLFLHEVSRESYDQNQEDPASSWEKERDKQVYWSVCILAAPPEYKVPADTGAQGTPTPSGYRGAEPVCISGVMWDPSN